MKKGFFYTGIMSLLPLPASALDARPDGVSATYGQYLPVVSGRKADYHHYRIGLQWDLDEELYRSDKLVMSGYFELGGSMLKSRLNTSDNPSPEGKDSATVVSFSPVFRFSSAHPLFGNTFPFLEAGLGGAWFSEKDLEKEKTSPINLGSQWLFEVRLGAGLTFGQQQQYVVSYSLLHYSNAGLASLNESIDFHAVTFGVKW